MTSSLGLVAMLIAGISLVSTAAASASSIVLFDRAAFDLAAGEHSLVTFDDVPSGPVSTCVPISPYIPDPCVATFGGIQFMATNTVGPYQRPLLSIYGGMIADNTISTQPGQFSATFGGQVFGFDVFSASPIAAHFTLTNGDQFSQTVVANQLTPTFLGVVLTEGEFANVSWTALPMLTGGTSNFYIDNVATGPVPEPATLLLIGTAATVAALRKRRSKSQLPSEPDLP